jgi:hypothetical protein
MRPSGPNAHCFGCTTYRFASKCSGAARGVTTEGNVRHAAYRKHLCNGYPIVDAAQRLGSRAALYFDSRMSSEMVMPRNLLNERLGYCHLKADRSCNCFEFLGTYLSLFGCWDRLWQGLAKGSADGSSACAVRPDKLADAVESLASNFSLLKELSRQSAGSDTFETEFDRRMNVLK